MNSSPYDDGTGTQVISRAILSTSAAQLSVIRQDDQSRRGGYVLAAAGSLFAGFVRAGVDGGYYYADSVQGRFGWNPNDADGQHLDFSSGNTHHIGRWADFASAGTTDGIWTASEPFVASGDIALSLGYGATMASGMVPLVTLRHTVLRTWQVTSSTATGLTVTVGTSSGIPSLGCWVYRV
jgi:hypothetical protein